jgi:trehalose 6-phosphate synthase/phosphatase
MPGSAATLETAPPRVATGFRRLVVASHRLPVEATRAHGRVEVRRTVGGLASGVSGFLASPFASSFAEPPLWIGWPGKAPTALEAEELRRAVDALGGFRAVRLPAARHAAFYDGFSNRTLWPLLHSFPSYVALETSAWNAYRAVNEAFADAIAEVLRPDDAVWIHDFHLMLVPALLRRRAPDAAVAYFHHVPFPPLDVLRTLPDPWAREILAGLLGADVAGFHTYDDARKALRAVEHLLGLDPHGGAVAHDGGVTRFDAFPIGVDFRRWEAAGDDPEVARARAALDAAFDGRTVVLSVDRLDYTKGILNRLLAFERLLERRPDWRRRVTLAAVVVPSRDGLDSYRAMRTAIEEAVGRVNGQHGDPSWTPVVYRYRALDPASLAAYYLRAQVALVTPLRDGMNLVAKEFLAARRDEDAVLVLSDMAGAARELGEAVIVNPFHVDGLSEALERALEMAPEERARRCRHMRSRLARYDVERWGRDQTEALVGARAAADALRARRLAEPERARLVAQWRAAPSRALLLDYDGTLVPFARDPAQAAPDRDVLALLASVASDPRTRVVVLSGRDAATLGGWLSALPVSLVAEHGARVRRPDGTWTSAPGLAPDVRARVLSVLEVFADRLPGSIVERKEVSVAWHWRAAEPEIGQARARELVDALDGLEIGPDAQVLVGKKVVEVRPATANKGTAAIAALAGLADPLVVAAGDDATDEDLFAALPASAWTLRVGPGESRARRNLDSLHDLRRLLGELAAADRDAPERR